MIGAVGQPEPVQKPIPPGGARLHGRARTDHRDGTGRDQDIPACRGHVVTAPPLMWMVWPVIQLDSSDARYTHR